jgi:hypothetical protein
MSSREYPAWFGRIQGLMQDRIARGQGDRYGDDPEYPFEPQDFDEDLSDCSNDSEESCFPEKGCKYDKYDNCSAHDADDQSSESSGLSDFSNASTTELMYYAMKEDREDRKIELKKQRSQGLNQP